MLFQPYSLLNLYSQFKRVMSPICTFSLALLVGYTKVISKLQIYSLNSSNEGDVFLETKDKINKKLYDH